MLNFLFHKNKKLSVDLWQSAVDIHSHLLPGVDDGSQSEEESAEILSFMYHQGVKRLFLTPHIMTDYSCNNADFLQKQFDCFTQQYQGMTVPQLRLAAEYMLDEQFAQHLDQGLLTYDGKHALVEMSCIQAPMSLYDKLYSIQLSGYTPILAHPERYLFLSSDSFTKLKEHGCEFQLNVFSLAGFYGEAVRSNAMRLLKQGMYTYAGSDIHSQDYVPFYSTVRLHPKEVDVVLELMNRNDSLWL